MDTADILAERRAVYFWLRTLSTEEYMMLRARRGDDFSMPERFSS